MERIWVFSVVCGRVIRRNVFVIHIILKFKHIRRYGWLLTGTGWMVVNFDCQLECSKGCLELCVCASVTKIIWSLTVCICWKWTLRSRKALYPNSSMYISSFLQNSLFWGQIKYPTIQYREKRTAGSKGVLNSNVSLGTARR